MRRLAILGGDPAFGEGLPFARPFTPPLSAVTERLSPSFDRGILTNGPLVRQLEEEAAARLGVGDVVAVSSCTAGLMLTMKALTGAPGPGDAPVVLPSFTFSASAHAVAWNGLRPQFAECDPRSFQVDVADAESRLDGAVAILATHVFGAPCPVAALEETARAAAVPLVFDAAHAFGATRAGSPVGGFGDAEVFSLSPTKLVVAGEGGLVATDHDDLARALRMGRDYGNPGNYDTQFVGLNARMSEMHAATALESLARLDDHLERRQRVSGLYTKLLAGVPGIATQVVDDEDRSTYKDFTIFVDEERFGLPRDAVVAALKAEGIDTRCYFSPPVHRQHAYAGQGAVADLPVTDRVAAGVVSLPIFADLPLESVELVAEVLVGLGERAGEVRAKIC